MYFYKYMCSMDHVSNMCTCSGGVLYKVELENLLREDFSALEILEMSKVEALQ